MKNIGYYLLFLLLLTSSCGNKGEASAEASEQSSTETVSRDTTATMAYKGDRKSDDYIKERVAFIYKHVFSENYHSEEESEMDFQDLPSPDEKFCTKEWNDLLSKIYEFDSVNNPDDIGFFDADYWIMGQDFENLSISDVELTKHDGNNASAEFSLHNFGSTTKVCVELKYERDDWFIDNFIDLDNNINWKKDMKDYLKK